MVSLFTADHEKNFWSSVLHRKLACCKEEHLKVIVVSSAKRTEVTLFETLGKSLMKNKKSKGPSLLPWKIPFVIGSE